MLPLLLLCFALACSLAALTGQTPHFWCRLTRASRTRRNARQARALNAALATQDERERELLRARLIGGANVIAMLDASKTDHEVAA